MEDSILYVACWDANGGLFETILTADDALADIARASFTYSGAGVVCAVMPYTKYVSLHFYKGVELDDPAGVLEGGGKALRHVKVHSLDGIDEKVLAPMIQQAVALDKA